MSAQIVVEYLSKLLNKSIGEHEQLALSSAQKSRVHGWLTKNNIVFNEVFLAKKFTVLELIGNVCEASKSSNLKVEQEVIKGDFMRATKSSIGIDIQHIDELFPNGLPTDPKADEGLTQIFTLKELSYAQSKDNPKQTLTGIFCAKEAIQKISNHPNCLNEIEVLPDDNGRPISQGYAISISHSKSYAIAAAIAELSKPQNIPIEFLKSMEPGDFSRDVTVEEKGNSLKGLRLIDYVYLALIVILGFGIVLK